MIETVFNPVFRNGIFRGVFGAPTTPAFSPSSLFSPTAIGTWLDPSDLSTMFQDSAGTIPVTAPGQAVGLRLDKSGGGRNSSQATAGLRLTYGIEPKTGTRNLLLATDTLATQSLTVTAVAHTLSFTGAGTVTLSGASTAGPLVGTGAGNRVSLTFTPTAASLTLTVSGSVTLAQLERGSVVTAYQKVVTAFEVTEAGVPTCHYCAYAGGTWMATANIDFTGTDKMSVFSAVRKAVNVDGLICELSTGFLVGSFYHYASVAGFGAAARGTAAGAAGQEASILSSAPVSAVLTATHDIAGDLSTIRLNGVAGTNGTADKGGGPFGVYAIYFGRRAGSTIAFTGRDYGIIVVGKVASASEIANTETWLSANTPEVTL